MSDRIFQRPVKTFCVATTSVACVDARDLPSRSVDVPRQRIFWRAKSWLSTDVLSLAKQISPSQFCAVGIGIDQFQSEDDLATSGRLSVRFLASEISNLANKGFLTQMNTTDIDRDLRTFLIDHFLTGRADVLTDDAPLQGNVIDSSGVLELVAYLQDHFGITVEDEEVISENLESVKSLVAYVARKVEGRP